MLDVSFGEFVLLSVAGVYFLGKGDLPIVARASGKMVGRAVGYILRVRESAEQVALSSSELTSLRMEVQQGYEQFTNIRHEVRSVSRINSRIPRTSPVTTQVATATEHTDTATTTTGHPSSTAAPVNVPISQTLGPQTGGAGGMISPQITSALTDTMLQSKTSAKNKDEFYIHTEAMKGGVDILNDVIEHQRLLDKYVEFVETGQVKGP